MNSETSCGIIVFYKEKKNILYLILHYSEGHWDFPKGHIEGKETHKETALRETKEETGLNPDIKEGFKESLSYFFKQGKELINKTVFYFIGESKSKSVKISDEHIGFGWLRFEDAQKKLTYQNSRDILKKADLFLKTKTLLDY
jgi:bis(5'-nucleosidyl)-tetraphosphatase